MTATHDSLKQSVPVVPGADRYKWGEMGIYKVGTVPVISRVITPLIGVKSPQLANYKAIYRVYNSIYDWKGPTLYNKWPKK